MNKRIIKFSTLFGAIIIAIVLSSVKIHAFNKSNQLGNQPENQKSHQNGYVYPTDTKVLAKLDKWQDLKFGVIFHWGLYSIPGIMESWTLCGEDADWITSRRTKGMSYEEYKRWYWSHANDFYPTKFDPSKWASLMKQAGMKYMVFTTKHHEGFCMFDSKQTDFTVMNSPYGSNPKANISKEVFNAFRNEDFMIGAYFSKPDWHSQYYWWSYFPTTDRNVNYDIKKFPERWEKFCNYTYNQIEELTNGDYGDIDILWLDGGQVQPANNQDIHMDKIAKMSRSHQPGLIIVDRVVRGEYENYQTPEGKIPSCQLDYPWETCEAMNGWGWRKKGEYKSVNYVLGHLIEVVSKGGNYLLGVGPTPEGTIDEDMTKHLEDIGEWMSANGEGIYSTINAEHYNDGNVWFTLNKDGRTMYAFYVPDGDVANLSSKKSALKKSALKESTLKKSTLKKSTLKKSASKNKVSEENIVPEIIEWTGNIPRNASVKVLSNGKRARCSINGNKVKVRLPKNVDRTRPVGLVFQIHD